MTVKQRQLLLAYLDYYHGTIDGDWGAQSQEACRKFQDDFGGIAVDGFGGPETDGALTHAVAFGFLRRESEEAVPESDTTGTFWDEIEYFDREEFRCQCGGKYCDGYPHEIQPLLVQILDRARRWSGNPIAVISGLRCDKWNSIQGGVDNSQHKYGEAVDVYFYGVSASSALVWLQSQPDVRYAYQIDGCSNIHFDIHKVGR